MREIRPDMMVNLLRVCGASWPQSCFLLFYFFVGVFSEDSDKMPPHRTQSVPPTHFDDDDGMHSPDRSMRSPSDASMSQWPSPISMEQSMGSPPGPPGGGAAAPPSPPAPGHRRKHDTSVGVHKKARWPLPRGHVRPAGSSFEKPHHGDAKSRKRIEYDSPSSMPAPARPPPAGPQQ